MTVVDLATAADVLRGEADENTCRKPLTPYEASRARERRAQVLAPKAEERKAQAIKERDDMGRAMPTSAKLAEVAPPSNRETRKVAAVGTGYSGSTLDKVDRIRDAAERGVIRQGKAEVPVPEPVREVAREALARVGDRRAAMMADPLNLTDPGETSPAFRRSDWSGVGPRAREGVRIRMRPP